ncbi:response regulator [Lichenihabitans sp. Uapishka_5]|uniref:response regulator n=1 Tax=Lichenihabitans sp. Uapishka_5 TaxID=3037302 RepID=UPI0029E7F544|nr:response regulator [Lichenihabitans sp. Uapishka_5]MDX7950233.1 response regulator [Lichenihabitans sp. Uapishka_5]
MMFSTLKGRLVFIVEDEYFLAFELKDEFLAAGARVLGPAPSVEQALTLLASEPRVDAAILNLNLGGEMSFPVAEALLSRGIPFVFTTGYGDGALDERYPQIARCEKPTNMQALHAALTTALTP